VCDSGLYLSTKAVTKASLILTCPSFATFEEGIAEAYDWITLFVTYKNQNINNIIICES